MTTLRVGDRARVNGTGPYVTVTELRCNLCTFHTLHDDCEWFARFTRADDITAGRTYWINADYLQPCP